MSPTVTPGLRFLSKALAPLVTSIGVVFYLNSFVANHTSVHGLPISLLFVGIVLSIPLGTVAYVISYKFLHGRQAAARGARMVPEAVGKLPGNYDILQMIIEKSKTGYPAEGLSQILERHGPVVNMRFLWSNLIFTASPEHIKTLLATDFQNYVKGDRFAFNVGAVLGSGVFNSDGEMWKFHRSITRPFFTRDRISHFELFDRGAQQVISKIKERTQQGYALDIQDVVSRFTLDSATEFLFGNCVDSLSAGLPYPHNAKNPPIRTHSARGAAADAFASAFLEAQEVISMRERMGWIWPLAEIAADKTAKPMQLVNAYLEPIVKEALEKKRNSPDKEKVTDQDEDGTLLDHLVNMTSDPKIIKDEILNIMIAGRDTTAGTLTFMIYFLALYPNVFAKLREEILSKVGHTRRPDYDDVKDMKYLRAVINETLRLFPIVPFNVRESVDATTWKSEDPNEKPYFIPAKTKMSYSVFMMHRRKDLWGPDAEEFDPDRFLDERQKTYLARNHFSFLPFNAGPRICLGQQFAYNEMSFMIIRLLQTFKSFELDLSSAPPQAHPPADWAGSEGRKGIEKVFPKMHLMLYANGGLWMKMHESDGSN